MSESSPRKIAATRYAKGTPWKGCGCDACIALHFMSGARWAQSKEMLHPDEIGAQEGAEGPQLKKPKPKRKVKAA